MNPLNLSVNKSYYIIHKQSNVIINLGNLYDFSEIKEMYFPWGGHEGPVFEVIGYKFNFADCKDYKIKHILSNILLSNYQTFINIYDGFFELR